MAASSGASGIVDPTLLDGDPPIFKINVKCIDGSIAELEVPSDLFGSDLKHLIAERLNVPAARQRLICRGRVVKDEDTVGNHITESGQTIHMVQRPEPTTGAASSSGREGEQNPSNDGPPRPTFVGQPQVHLQFTTANDTDITQLMQLLTSTLRGNRPPAQANAASGAAGSGAEGGGGNAGGSSDAASASASRPSAAASETNPVSQARPTGQPGQPDQPGQPGQPGQPAGTVDFGQLLFQGLDQPLGQADGFQALLTQGFGSLMTAIPGMLGEVQADAADAAYSAAAMAAAAAAGVSRSSAVDSSTPEGFLPRGDALPWRDLRRLHTHLGRVLGRTQPAGRQLSYTGETSFFLASLVSATAQLGVALSELTANLAEGNPPPARQRIQLAMMLVAAYRTFRGMATALQLQNHGIREVSPSAESAASPAPEASSQQAAGSAAASTLTGPPLASEGEEAEDGVNSRDERDEQLQRIDELLDRFPAPELELRPEIEDDVVTSVTGRGDAAAAAVASLGDPDVASCWSRWTQPESFSCVLSQARQAPFSDAYISGDSTSSHRAPTLPPPNAFLPLRWERSARRVRGLADVPPHPDHLSRAYLSAFLRDLGHHVEGDATYNSMADAADRYPHLAQIRSFVSATSSASRVT